ncbi:glycosyltransferase family 4 protein [Alcaligenes endophyticus]|uniref:Glycosyltransferase family 4 protein n=1 Tax=Alcaligenes endophyticus TaxID=1929088 RepID=A0ABT8ENQ6_9BURK|nr:glycosyltransferase family 4 protein [Alcaligenes endophyticus]MCX5591297.1 glycosyltransferase family 4 protein [Alcaligenes endophyticus]MDN4122822.1 glycosyltransferase family 4 protein [Alcaligenes endophyticus]
MSLHSASGSEFAAGKRGLRLAFVVDKFGNRFGGAESYGVELMRQLAQYYEITVIAREYDAHCDLRLPFLPITLSRHWPSWIRSFFFARAAAKLTRDGFDLVHSHMNGWCGDVEVVHVTPVRYQWRVRVRSWWKTLDSYLSPRVAMYLGLEKRRLEPRAGHRVVAVSGLIVEQLQQAYHKLYAGQTYPVIPPGVHVQAYYPQHPVRQKIRQNYGWEKQDIVCLLVARNPLRKGLHTVLQAMAMLAPHYKLLVVGGETSLYAQLEPELLKCQLVDRVSFQEATANVEPYYRAADIYVHPTLNDSFGMAPLEAMSFGLPVILSPTPWCGFAEYVEHEKTALLLSHPENAHELADYIRRFGEQPLLAQRLRENAMSQVASQHTWGVVAEAYDALYREILAEKLSA